MLNVGVAIRFAPSEVGMAVYQCLEEVPTPLEVGNATVCLTIHKSSLDQLGEFAPVDSVPHPQKGPSPILRTEWAQESKSHLRVHFCWCGKPGSVLSPSPSQAHWSVSRINLDGVCELLSTCPATAFLEATLLFCTYTPSCSPSCFCTFPLSSKEELE